MSATKAGISLFYANFVSLSCLEFDVKLYLSVLRYLVHVLDTFQGTFGRTSGDKVWFT